MLKQLPMRFARRSFLATAGAAALAAGPKAVVAQAADPWAEGQAIVARTRAPSFPSRTFAVTSYGARGNGSTDCTDAFRRAIAACNAAGGGRVVVPPGRYRSGVIRLLSNVNLVVEEGATIAFYTDPARYLPAVRTRFEGNDCYNYSPMIYAFRQSKIAVTGRGVLDAGANERVWWPWSGKPQFGWQPGQPQQGPARRRLQDAAQAGVPVENRRFGAGDYLRPSMIQPYGCTNVFIEGVTLKNAPMWCLHPLLCTRVLVRRVKVSSLGANNDGCDPESCTQVVVEFCSFDTGDDCIAIKSGRGRDGIDGGVPSRDIVVRDCVMRRGVAGVAIGSEGSAGVNGVYLWDLVMDDPELSTGLHVKSNAERGGLVERVHARDIEIAGVRTSAVRLSHYYNEVGQNGGPYRPTFRDMDFLRVTSGACARAIEIRGYRSSPIRDIRFTDCRFTRVAGPRPTLEGAQDITFTRVRVNGEPIRA